MKLSFVEWAIVICFALTALVLSPLADASEREYEELADWMFYQGQILIIADWATTKYCADRRYSTLPEHKNLNGCEELNPIVRPLIGREIDTDRLAAWSLVALGLNWWMQDQFTSQKHRLMYNTVHVGLRFWAVQNNLSFGAKLRF